MNIGVLALQGDFIEHIHVLQILNVTAQEVRVPQDLQNLDGLIIPGGESTTIGKLAKQYNLIAPLKEKIASGFPVWGTCAGMILLADHSYDTEKAYLDNKVAGFNPATARTYKWIGGMDIAVVRNAFGRQVDSFEEPIMIEGIKDSDKLFNAVFIRAPLIAEVGKNAQILSKLSDGTIVAAKQKNLLVTSFHPELSNDFRVHEYFLSF